ncbi:hypothetical protein FXO38_19086 [Capsicum annuum]|nr:hypothetical protein FXO38_19086 [Capsicum annuum]
MKIFKPYTDELKDMSIDALKVKLKRVIVLTSSAEVADEDEDKDLGGHNYVPSPARVCDHTSSSGLKTTSGASNDDDLRKSGSVIEKSVLDIAFFVRNERLRRIKKNKKKHQDKVCLDSPPRSSHQVNLEELAVVVTNITAVDKKAKEERKKKK